MKCSCGCGREQILHTNGKPVIFANGARHCKVCGNLCWVYDLRRGMCFSCYVRNEKKKPKQLGLDFIM